MNPSRFILLTALLLFAPGPANAASATDGPSGAFGLTMGTMSGNTLYHISLYDATGSGIESELEFPLNVLLYGFEWGYRNDNAGTGAFRIDLRGLFNFDSGSGKLKDSDWLTSDFDINFPTPGAGFAHPGLDIYSESDITLTARIFDLRASYATHQSDRWSIGPLAGYLYEKFSYEASNVHQVGYGPYAAQTVFVPGKVLTYDVTYSVPYIGIRSENRIGTNFQTVLDLAYSPWASASDRDDHVLRSKLSEGSCTGTASLLSVSGVLGIETNDDLQLTGQYLRIKTTGTQTQTFYDGSGAVFSGINDRIESKQTTLLLLYRHRY